ncbi:MarC family protein [Shewanella gelidimarina]|uniref:MarC family protein n=1 Tax=Shewanella gelidimarina TaxID=56813 RepID=UPI00200F3A5E|nr:MarC family protein [Shewanella gelidimarina]MCL1060227.1 MarC family protein [Shewanella gelidimarina]
MSQLLAHSLAVFMAFFAIMNPIANTTVFAGLTASMSKAEQTKTAIKSLTITFIIIVLFSLLGKSIFNLFGITLPALRIAGGILVFLVGYHMLHGKSSKLHTAEPANDSDVAVSPLAVPLLAGPGTIATAMNYSAAGGWGEITVTVVAFAALCLITFICFVFSSKIIAAIGENGLSIVTRLMGLILSVIGVQMLIDGITAVVSSIG